MARYTREQILDRLRNGETTLAEAANLASAKHMRVEDLVRADSRRGRRQARSMMIKAQVAGWLEVRHVTDAQLERVEAVLKS